MGDRGMRAAQLLKGKDAAKTTARSPATSTGTTKPVTSATKAASISSSSAAGKKPPASTSAAGGKAPAAAKGAPPAAAPSAEGLVRDIEAGNLQAVQDRLKTEKPNTKYVDPKAKGVHFTPLHAAARAGSLPILEALLGAGADMAAADNDGATPLHWLAAAAGHKDSAAMAEALLRQGCAVATLDATQRSALHAAAAAGNAAVLSALCMAPGAEPDGMQPGYAPMHAAVKARRFDCVDALLGAGATLDVHDAQGRTPLMALSADGGGSAAEVAALLAKGDCRLDAADAGGHTALSLACGRETPDLELVRVLLAAGASPDAAPDAATGRTIVMEAVSAAAVGGGKAAAAAVAAVAKALVAASKDLRRKGAGGETALSLATAGGDELLIAAILSALGPPEATGPQAVALAKSALEGRRDGTVAALVPLLSSAQLSALELTDPRAVLLESGLPASAVALLQRLNPGKGVDQPLDDEGNSLLHVAAATATTSYDICTALIALGLSPNAPNKADGSTPLHTAARSGNIDACRACLDGGADPTKRNSKNRMPGNQPKIPDSTKNYLASVEEEYTKRRQEMKSDMFGEKIRATQTESAFGVRAL